MNITFEKAIAKAISGFFPVEGKENAKKTFLSDLCDIIGNDINDGKDTRFSYASGSSTMACITHHYGSVYLFVNFKRGKQHVHPYGESTYEYYPVKAYCSNEEYMKRPAKEVFEELTRNNDDYQIETRVKAEVDRIFKENEELFKMAEEVTEKVYNIAIPYQDKLNHMKQEGYATGHFSYYNLPEYKEAEKIYNALIEKLKPAWQRISIF